MSRAIKKITPEVAEDLSKKWKDLYKDALYLANDTMLYFPKSTAVYRKCNTLAARVNIVRWAVADAIEEIVTGGTV